MSGSSSPQSSERELLGLVDRVVAQARGGEAVEAIVLDQTETSVRAYDAEVESLASARTRGLGVRVIDAGRVGYAYTAELSDAALRGALDEARTNAAVATPDDANVLPEPRPVEPLALYDPAFAATSAERKVALALDLEAVVRGADRRIKGVDSCTYGDSETIAAIASTTGVRASSRRCDCYVLVEALAEADGATTSAYGLDVARVPDALDIDRAGAEAATRALRLLGGRKPPSARLPVLLDPVAAASLLGVVAGGLSAESVQKGRSLFAERLGDQLGGPHLTLVDDGRRTDGLAAAAWDGEGVPTQRTVLIDGGRLEGWLHNSFTAAKDATDSTGNASRAGYKSPPGVAPTNLYLEPGAAGPEALLARAGTAFYCQQIMGVHSGANPISGEISVGAAGMMVRDGELAEPVREATIAGTIPELLASLSAVGSDLRFLPFGGGLGGSTWLVDELALSGA